MIYEMHGRPDGHFENEATLEGSYFGCIHSAKTYAYLKIERQGINAAVHVSMVCWSPEIAKEAKADFERLKEWCKKRDIKTLTALTDRLEDKKVLKFWRFMGWGEPITIKFTTMEIQ